MRSEVGVREGKLFKGEMAGIASARLKLSVASALLWERRFTEKRIWRGGEGRSKGHTC